MTSQKGLAACQRMSPQKSPTGRASRNFFLRCSIRDRPVSVQITSRVSRPSPASFTSAGHRVRQTAAAGFDNIWHLVHFIPPHQHLPISISTTIALLQTHPRPEFYFIDVLCELERARRSAALWVRSASYWHLPTTTITTTFRSIFIVQQIAPAAAKPVGSRVRL